MFFCLNSATGFYNLGAGEAGAALHGTFPQGRNPPAHVLKLCVLPVIPRNVALDLHAPKFLSCRRPTEEMAVMAMPEATMNEKNGSIARKNQIGTARQVFAVQAEPEPGTVKC